MAAITPTTRTPVAPARPSRWARWAAGISILAKSKVAMFGLALVGFWVIAAIFADDCLFNPKCWGDTGGQYVGTPWLARYSPYFQFSGENLQGPSAKHWLGTDRLGRDLWARLAHGARVIFSLTPLAVLLALAVGGTLGLVAGYYGGIRDEIIMRVLDSMIAFPQIVLYLVILAALGPNPINVVLAIILAGAPGIARLVRSLTLDIMTRDYVAAARTRGENPWYIMFVEILPNARGPIIVDAMLRMGYAIFALGTLGFLGLGLPPPSPDWGSIVNAGRKFILSGHIWDALWGSLATASLVVGLNMMADGLSEELQKYR
jgi:peptide/nickel transport system permease protein